MKTWKTPEILRLSCIEKWAEARLKRRMKERDATAALRAANFYAAIAHRVEGIVLYTVSSH